MKIPFIGGLFFGIPLQEKILFAKHLALMLRSGMTLVASLKILSGQAKSGRFKKIIDQLVSDVENGQFLSASLEKHRESFGDVFVNITRVGEASGTLSDNLDHLSVELKKKRDLNGKVKGALVYPAIILVATFGIGSLLVFFIFPKILPILTGLNVKLPITTRILIAVSRFISQNGLVVALAAVLLTVALGFLMRFKTVRFFSHKFLLVTPFFGGLAVDFNAANFSRVLATLLKSGIKIVESLEITASSFNNLVYRRAIRGAAEAIKKGEPLSKHLDLRSDLFPSTLVRMIEVGESTGNLEENLFYLADFYESEVDSAVKNLSTVLEPVLLIVMGGLVAFIALAVITPIYGITTQTLN